MFETARAAAADHFRRRWALTDPAFADTESNSYILDNDHNINQLGDGQEPVRDPANETEGNWYMFGSFDGTITGTVRKKKDGTYWCPATSLIR
jgi:hypothetical protein